MILLVLGTVAGQLFLGFASPVTFFLASFFGLVFII